jgi:hypothetical protein
MNRLILLPIQDLNSFWFILIYNLNNLSELKNGQNTPAGKSTDA